MRGAFLKIATPTLLFAVPIFVYEWITYQPGASFRLGTWTLLTIIVVPLTWWFVAGVQGPIDRGRWVGGGALAGAIIILVPSLSHLIPGMVGVLRGRGSDWGDAILVVSALSTSVLTSVLASFGAGMGALAAALLGRRAAKAGLADSRTTPGHNG